MLVASVVLGVIVAIDGLWGFVPVAVIVALPHALNVRALRRSRDG